LRRRRRLPAVPRQRDPIKTKSIPLGRSASAVNTALRAHAEAPPLQTSAGIADGLARLVALQREGVLTPEELDRLKRQITDRSSGVEDVIRLLRGLKALEREGVLTEGELNLKKWDILSKRPPRKD
jgi:hypothetical protein